MCAKACPPHCLAWTDAFASQYKKAVTYCVVKNLPDLLHTLLMRNMDLTGNYEENMKYYDWRNPLFCSRCANDVHAAYLPECTHFAFLSRANIYKLLRSAISIGRVECVAVILNALPGLFPLTAFGGELVYLAAHTSTDDMTLWLLKHEEVDPRLYTYNSLAYLQYRGFHKSAAYLASFELHPLCHHTTPVSGCDNTDLLDEKLMFPLDRKPYIVIARMDVNADLEFHHEFTGNANIVSTGGVHNKTVVHCYCFTHMALNLRLGRKCVGVDAWVRDINGIPQFQHEPFHFLSGYNFNDTAIIGAAYEERVQSYFRFLANLEMFLAAHSRTPLDTWVRHGSYFELLINHFNIAIRRKYYSALCMYEKDLRYEPIPPLHLLRQVFRDYPDIKKDFPLARTLLCKLASPFNGWYDWEYGMSLRFMVAEIASKPDSNFATPTCLRSNHVFHNDFQVLLARTGKCQCYYGPLKQQLYLGGAEMDDYRTIHQFSAGSYQTRNGVAAHAHYGTVCLASNCIKRRLDAPITFVDNPTALKKRKAETSSNYSFHLKHQRVHFGWSKQTELRLASNTVAPKYEAINAVDFMYVPYVPTPDVPLTTQEQLPPVTPPNDNDDDDHYIIAHDTPEQEDDYWFTGL